MPMSRRDFTQTAELLKQLRIKYATNLTMRKEIDELIIQFADAYALQYPNFNREVFIHACLQD